MGGRGGGKKKEVEKKIGWHGRRGDSDGWPPPGWGRARGVEKKEGVEKKIG